MAGGAGFLRLRAFRGSLRSLLPTLAPVALPLSFVLGSTAAASPLLFKLDLGDKGKHTDTGSGEQLPVGHLDGEVYSRGAGIQLVLLTWIRVCSISLGGTEAACKTLWMRNVWSRDTSSRSPSSSSSSRWVLVAAESSTTCPFSEGSSDSRHPTSAE